MAEMAVVEFSRPVDVATLQSLSDAPLAGEADHAERAALALRYGVPAVNALRFSLTATPAGNGGWIIAGTASAEIVQTCVVTLEPVTAMIDEQVERRFVPQTSLPPEPVTGELELSAASADGPDGFTDSIDFGEIATEAVALAIDPYPRAPDAHFQDVVAGPAGAEPLTDEAARPFAGLAALKARMPPS